jgi:hypothetical protein
MTNVDDDLLKVMSWSTNECGYSSQLVREALRIARTIDRPDAQRAPSRGAAPKGARRCSVVSGYRSRD